MQVGLVLPRGEQHAHLVLLFLAIYITLTVKSAKNNSLSGAQKDIEFSVVYV